MPLPDDLSSKRVSTVMEPIQVTVVGGTGNGGTGSVKVVTPAGQPDYVINSITTFAALLTRFIDTFLTVLLAVIGVAGVSDKLIPFQDFADLVRISSSVALTGACLGLGKDLLVVVSKLKKRFPLLDV